MNTVTKFEAKLPVRGQDGHVLLAVSTGSGEREFVSPVPVDDPGWAQSIIADFEAVLAVCGAQDFDSLVGCRVQVGDDRVLGSDGAQFPR